MMSNVKSGMSSHSWVKFFKDAGIPAELSAKYAVMFTDHRIQKDMLADLDRDILSDIGITAVGDKMAIMKHAKFVAEQAKRDASSKLLADGVKTLEDRSNNRSSPAERMIKHTINSRSPSGRNSPKILSTEVEDPSEEASQKSAKDTMKSTVFDRLGRNSPNNSPLKPNGVFNRLGGETKKSEEFPYAGVLKQTSSPSATKKKILVHQKSKSTSVLDRLGAEKHQEPDTSLTVKPSTTGKTVVVKKVIAVKKKPVVPPTRSIKTTALKHGLETTALQTTANCAKVTKKSNVLDRLGSVVTSTTKHSNAHTQESVQLSNSSKVKPKLIVMVPKKMPKVTLKRKSTGTIAETIVKKPISSNTVSSTSSVGLFRGVTHSSVFDRLGPK